jgi:hypothetical protein
MDIRKTIQNLLDLAGGTHSRDEAEAAMLKAQELMLKYRVSEDDLKPEDVKITTQQVMVDIGFKKVPFWVWQLAMVIADNFRCFTWKSSKWFDSNPDAWTSGAYFFQPVFMGTEDDVKIAVATFKFAVRAAKSLYRQFRDANGVNYAGDRNAYYRGFVDGLRAKYRDQVQSKALIIVKPDQVVERHNEIAKGFRKGTASNANVWGSDSAREAGYRDGRSCDRNQISA